ncbi:MAG: VCBS repeat-containing protein, partial [Chitinophagaceae bacterium]|nr:VCBS repeat-containing protein [Chitinophagaceae bacterium]
TIEPILTYYLNGGVCTVADRDQIATEIPAIKKKFDTYEKFASADFSNIFTPGELKNAMHLTARSFTSVYLENKGNGKFVMRSLPMEAQFSAVQSIQVQDFDGDGRLDAIVLGNYFSPDFVTGRYDASHGLLLKGDGKGSFAPVPAAQSGLFVTGDMRSSALIRIKNSTCLLAAVNSGKLRCFKINKH